MAALGHVVSRTAPLTMVGPLLAGAAGGTSKRSGGEIETTRDKERERERERARARESGRAGERESGRAGERESGRAGERYSSGRRMNE